MDKICNRCNTKLLLGENWCKWKQKKHDYTCKGCNNKRTKSRPLYKQQRLTNIIKKQFELSLSKKISNFMQDAKRRGIYINLTYTEVGNLMLKACFYCGNHKKYNGLDRVNSNLHYTIDNVVPCCKACNWGKNSMSQKEYIEHCKQVVNFSGGILCQGQ